MNKIKFIFIILAVSMLMAGITSCSNDNVSTVGGESYLNGTYSGGNLNFMIDGVSLQDVTVNVTIENTTATIKLTGFPESGSTATWISTIKETDDGIECSGESSNSGQTYRYKVLFQGSYSSTSCKIECETVN